MVADNGQDGMKLNDTSDLQVWNNSLRGNARQVEIVQDARRGATLSYPGHDPRQSLPDATEPWIIRNIDLENNLIEAPAAGNYALNVRDYSGQYAAGNLQLKIDFNNFVRVEVPSAEIVWQITAASAAAYTSVSQFAAATGGGTHNTERDSGGAVNDATASPLTTALAALIGQPAGVRHLGAFG